MTTQSRADAALILISLLWGGSFVVMKDAMDAASTVYLLAIRFTLATLMLLALELGKLRRIPRTGLRWIALAGLLLAVAYVSQSTGLRLTTAGKSAFLTGLYIAFAPLLTAVFFRSKPRPSEWAGVALSTIGMALMNAEGFTIRLGWGEWLTVICAVLFAAHLLVLGHAVRELDARHAGLLQIAMCTVVLWLALPWIETPRVEWSPRFVLGVFWMAALSTALPFTLLSWAQKHTSAVRAGLLMSLEMPFAAFIAWAALGERMDAKTAAGAALILAGVLLVELKSERA